MLQLKITCLCGAASQTITAPAPPADDATGLALCHCETCRHTTGLLCTSYRPIPSPVQQPSLRGLKSYRSTPTTVRHFCATCGCHVLRAREQAAAGAAGAGGVAGRTDWEVATGVVVSETRDGAAADESGEEGWPAPPPRYRAHLHVSDTRDGGLSVWLRAVDGVVLAHDEGTGSAAPDLDSPRKFGAEREEKNKEQQQQQPTGSRETTSTITTPTTGQSDDVLPGHCHCGNVRFHITRPDDVVSRRPRSQFPDLMIPYHEGRAEVPNPSDEKWWLRPPRGGDDDGTGAGRGRYLAGTCACRSCRLSSGFEIQTWAFVPRANIFLHVPDRTKPSRHLASSLSPRPAGPSPLPPAAGSEWLTAAPLDFDNPSQGGGGGVLASFASSEGVRREFCGVCGATVFWHDAWRPELVDVSVGLLSTPPSPHPGSSSSGADGARAGSWLDWWTQRVSFSEDAGLGRHGFTARRARDLIQGLEEGLSGSNSS